MIRLQRNVPVVGPGPTVLTPRQPSCRNMTNGNRTIDWIALAKIAQESFFNRRQLEWRLSLGFWSAIGALTWLFFTVEGIQVPSNFSCILGIACGIVFILSIPFWHLPLQIAHGGDKKYYFYYLKRAQRLDGSPPEGKGTWKDVDKLWFYSHVLFSFFFLALSWYLITHIALPTSFAKSNTSESIGQATK